MRCLRGVVFDLDDTLIGSTAAMRAAIAAILPLLPGTTPQALIEALTLSYHALWGYGTPGYSALKTIQTPQLRTQLTEAALQRLGVHDNVLIAPVVQHYAVAEHEALRALPDVRAVLDALRPHFRLGILTNGPSLLQREKLAQVGLAQCFDVVVADADFGTPKPDPGLFAYTQELLGLDKIELLFVGDSPSADIAGARAAGWHSVYVGEGACPEAAFCITAVKELLTLEPFGKTKGLAIRPKVADTRD